MIATVQDRVEFQNLGEQWNALASRFQTPLLRHEWFAACVEGFCPPDKLALFVLSDRHDVSAIAPFALVQTAAGERLEFLGATILGEPSGFLYRDEDSLQALLKAVFLLEKPILVARVPEQSLEARHMDTMLRGARGFTVKRSSGSPWIPLNGTWGEFEGRMSSSRRSSLRRLRRRAESLGRVDFDFRTPSSNEVGGLLEDFFAVEASSWKGTLGTAVQQDPRTKRFFTTYAEAEARQGMLRLAFLRIDGQPIAALVAVESENRFWVLKASYDESMARCSPGILLMHESIRWACERRLEAFEFLGQDEDWMHMWTDHVHPYVSHFFYPLSAPGMVGLGSDVSRALKRKANAWIRKESGIWARKFRGLA